MKQPEVSGPVIGVVVLGSGLAGSVGVGGIAVSGAGGVVDGSGGVAVYHQAELLVSQQCWVLVQKELVSSVPLPVLEVCS